MKFLVTAAGLDKSIAEIATTRKDQQEKIGLTSTNCVLFAIAEGDYRPMEALLRALGASEKGKQKTEYRVNELGDWFVKHGPVVRTKEEGKFFAFSAEKRALLKAEFDKDWMAMAKSLNANPFWSEKPAAEFKGMDISKWLMAGYNRVGKIEADAEMSKHKDNKGFEYKQVIKQLADAIKNGRKIELVEHTVQ